MEDRHRAPRVLLIEDEFLQAFDLKCELEHRGWEVVGPASTVEAALRLASTTPLDYVISDIDLLGSCVYEALRLVVARSIPCVLVSGLKEPKIPDWLYSSTLYLRKPADIEEIVAALLRLEKNSGGSDAPMTCSVTHAVNKCTSSMGW